MNKNKKYELDSIVCTCREVSLGEIVYAIKDRNANSLYEISKLTDAGVCCKSCISECNEIRLNIPTPLYLDTILNKTKNK
jgi:bacterioferritin-associated ferredoxin